MSSIEGVEPYQIAVPDEALEKLKAKLALATFPEETSFSNDPKYGARLEDVKRLAGAWRDSFDWRRAEAELNKIPQFTTKIDVEGHEELDIHFVHQRSERKNAIPLLFCHGWPGSFLEVTKMLPLLTTNGPDDNDDSEQPTFHVVAPSLPNFGFSQRTSKPGFSIPQYAEVCHKLMQRLGYTRYATQGGDWGFMITRAMGFRYPDSVVASHMNFILTRPPSLLRTPLLALQALLWLTDEEKAGLARSTWFRDEGSGYNRIQGTKPHTPGFALADSPVALLAWIYEKLVDWTDEYPWTDDEVLTWISVYAFSAAGPESSVRIYYEAVHSAGGGVGASSNGIASILEWNGKVPLGWSYFPRDLFLPPSSWGKTCEFAPLFSLSFL
ncbi:hypothetical protein M426DRAFT_316959 [Hypoxylon sp. CI-4A]|nr:hypothetical protein M426DRAFT_316959 [Hypoxylon sp. CI-4A]